MGLSLLMCAPVFAQPLDFDQFGPVSDNLRSSAFSYGARPFGMDERHYLYKALDPVLLIRWDDFSEWRDKALEGAFWAVENVSGSGPKFRGYSAQGNTFLWEGNSISGLKFTAAQVTHSPRVRRCIDGTDYTQADFNADTLRWDSLPIFNEGGIWLRSGYNVVDSGGQKVVRGWYHTESMGCYIPSLPRHSISSMGYAESYDGGKTFFNKSTKPLLGMTDEPQIGVFNGLLAATVIKSNSFLYMYFVGKDPITGYSQVRAARSQATDPSRMGIQGTWSKWLDGRFINAYESTNLGLFSPVLTANGDRFNNRNPGISPAYNQTGDSLLMVWPQEDGISYSEEFQPDGVSFRKGRSPLFLSEHRAEAVRRTIPMYRYYSSKNKDYWVSTSSEYLFGDTTPERSKGYYPDRTLTSSAFMGYMYQRAERYRGAETIPLYHCETDVVKNGQVQRDQVIRVPGIDVIGSNGCKSTDIFKYNPKVIGQLWPRDVPLVGLPKNIVPVYRYFSPEKNSYLIGPQGLDEQASEILMVDEFLGYGPKNEAGDLIRNVSIVGPEGGKEFSNTFYLFYTMVRRGDENYKRQYMRRKIVVTPVSSSRKQFTLTSLANYSDASTKDEWATTTLPFKAYKWRRRLGYVFNRVDHDDPDLVSLYDCVRSRANGRKDHVLRAREQGCLPGEKKLRRLGFIFKPGTPLANRPASRPLYTCLDRDKISYVASNHPACGSSNYSNSLLIGYLSK